jgi:hypothetical protein
MDVLIGKLQSGDPLSIAFCIAALSVVATWYSFYFQYRVWNWTFVWGDLVQSRVASGGGGSSSADRNLVAQVEYNYTVNGKEYSGTRLSAMAVSTNMSGLLEQQLQGAETTEGGQVKVYHDPKKPHKAYLIRGSKTQVIFTFVYFLIALAVTGTCAQKLDLF